MGGQWLRRRAQSNSLSAAVDANSPPSLQKLAKRRSSASMNLKIHTGRLLAICTLSGFVDRFGPRARLPQHRQRRRNELGAQLDRAARSRQPAQAGEDLHLPARQGAAGRTKPASSTARPSGRKRSRALAGSPSASPRTSLASRQDRRRSTRLGEDRSITLQDQGRRRAPIYHWRGQRRNELAGGSLREADVDRNARCSPIPRSCAQQLRYRSDIQERDLAITALVPGGASPGSPPIGLRRHRVDERGSGRCRPWCDRSSDSATPPNAPSSTMRTTAFLVEESGPDEVRRLTRNISAFVRTRADFLATMSHELRTPLNGIINMNELMLGTQARRRAAGARAFRQGSRRSAAGDHQRHPGLLEDPGEEAHARGVRRSACAAWSTPQPTSSRRRSPARACNC